MALQQPLRYAGFLDHAVEDWLAALIEGLQDAGLVQAEARRAATLVVALARGLLLDLLRPVIGNASTGQSIPSWARFGSASRERRFNDACRP